MLALASAVHWELSGCSVLVAALCGHAFALVSDKCFVLLQPLQVWTRVACRAHTLDNWLDCNEISLNVASSSFSRHAYKCDSFEKICQKSIAVQFACVESQCLLGYCMRQNMWLSLWAW
jgi:hypothetical protein